MLEQIKSRKWFFVLTAAVICLIIICSSIIVVLYLQSDPSDAQSSPSININQPETLPQGYLSADQALEIAKPYFNHYAEEYNRTIIEIRLTYSNSTVEGRIDIPHSSWRHYPGWTVEAFFHMDPFLPSTPFGDPKAHNYFDESYYICLQADTGQIVDYNVKVIA